MKLIFFVLFVFCSSVSAEKVTFASKCLGYEVNLNISLPKSYYKNKAEFPVVFVLDGGGYFGVVKEYATALYAAHKIPELIVVGIPNKNRFQDFVGKNSDNFRKFVEQELHEFINKSYRTNRYNIVLGHSLGATFSLNSMFSKQPFFSAIVANSPVINAKYIPEEKLQKTAESYLKNNNLVFLSKGDEQGVYQEKIPPLAKVLTSQNMKFMHFNEDNHASSPIIAFYHGLSFLFKDWMIPAVKDLSSLNSSEKLAALGGYKGIKDYYLKYSQVKGYQQGIPAILLSRIAWIYAKGGNTQELFELMKVEGKNRTELFQYLSSYFTNKSDPKTAKYLIEIDHAING